MAYSVDMAEPEQDAVAVRLDIAVSNAKSLRNQAGALVRTVAQIRDDYREQQAQSQEDTASESDTAD